MIKNKITVKEILEDKYIDFKNKYWDKVPKHMRVQIDETVNKAIKCSDTKYDFAEYCGGECSLEQDCKRKGIPVMECPNCNADFYYSGEKKTEEGSYWIDEDEPIPF